MTIHTDCRHYRGNIPCRFHKRDGRLCHGCKDHDPIQARIVVVKLDAIGDVLRTTSILPPLKEQYPGAEITWVTRSNAAPLLEGNPLIDRVLIVEGQCLEFLLNESFSYGICLDADPRSASIHSIARCERRDGFITDSVGRVQPANDRAREWWLMGLNDRLKRQNRRTYQEIMYDICGLTLPVARPQLAVRDEDRATADMLRRDPRLHDARRILGINTGGGTRWQHKKWTVENYIACIERIRARFPGIGILLLGGPEEEELNAEILNAVDDDVVDAGCGNPLMQFVGIVALVDVLLTSDSLAMHIGVALEKAAVGLVGPTSPWELAVFGKGEILHSDIECLSCYLTRCDKDPHCMNTLHPETVVSALSEYL